jgi:hypothetical protein
LFATIHLTYVSEAVYNEVRSYDLGLDSDNDFSIEDTSVINYNYNVHCLKATSFYAAGGSSGSTPKAYAALAGLGTYHWQNGSGELCDYNAQNGPFGDVDKYLLVKFSNGTNNYYSWIRLITVSGSVHVDSYAYNDVPDEPITAEQTSTTGIDEINNAFYQITHVTPNGINFNNNVGFNKVMVSTIDGKVVGTINQPTANQQYTLPTSNGMLIVSYFKDEKLLASTKFIVVE